MYLLAALLLSAPLLPTSFGFDESLRDRPPRTWVGLTLPSESLEIGPAQDGVIAVMAVKEGQVVRKGDPLFELTTELQELEVQRLRVGALSDTDVREAQARLVQAEREEKRQLDLHQKGITGDSDLDKSRREAEIARIELEKARLVHDTNVFRYREAKARLAQRIVKCPIHGYVAKRHLAKGEPVERFKPVVFVVSLDPLWVEFDCDVEDAGLFPKGGKARVRHAANPATSADAVVVFASRTADPASQTFKVRLELSGKEKWKAGLKVVIEQGAQ